jgi:hypothetical protein
MSFLSGVHCSYRCHHKLRPNTKGDTHADGIVTVRTETTEAVNGLTFHFDSQQFFQPGSRTALARYAFSDRNLHSMGAIAFHAFAPLEALAGVWPMAFLSGVHFSYRFAL